MTYPMTEEPLAFMEPILRKPFVFNDLKVTVVNAIWLYHPSNWETEEHTHPYYEFTFLVEGAFATKIDGRVHQTAAGQASLVRPFCRHSNAKLPSTAYDRGFCLRFALEKAATDGAETAFPISDDVTAQIDALCGAAIPFAGDAFLAKLVDADLFTLQMLVVNFLLELVDLRSPETGREPTVDPLSSKERALAEEAVFYLGTLGNETPDVREMAKALYVSYRQLSRVFKKAYGKGIIQYHNDLRMQYAAKLLCESDASIRELAERLGFENESYFYVRFQKTMGVSPGTYRRQKRQGGGI